MNRRGQLIAATLTAGGLLACGVASGASPLPKLTTATVLGDRVLLNFSGVLRPGTGNWTIVVNGAPVRAKAVTHSGKRVQLVLPKAVFSDDALRVVGRNLRSRTGVRLKLVDTTPANRSKAGCTREIGTVAKGVAGEGPTDADTFLQPDRIRVLAVQVDYDDVRASALDGLLGLGTVDGWIRELSYGRASVVATRRPGVVRMPKNSGDYAYSGAWSARKAFFQELVWTIDAEIDFNNYDAIVVTAARRRLVTPTSEPVAIAPVGAGITADGRELRHFAISRSPVADLRSVLQLAGLPELPGGYVGEWDPMGYGRNETGLLGMLAWHRRKLGWMEPSQVRCLGSDPLEVTLEPTWRPGGVKAVVVQTSKTTAIVLENRQRSGLDAGHCRKGVLAYEVRTDWQYHLWLLAADRTGSMNCEALAGAPYDFRPKDSTRVQGTTPGVVTFEVLASDADGSYRLRISR